MSNGLQEGLAPARASDYVFMTEAYNEAESGFSEGGVPVGAVMVKDGIVVARGRNQRVQKDDPVLHGETDCLRAGGLREDYAEIDLYTTLSPCMMCTGAILKFGIRRVVIGEDISYAGNIPTLLEHGVEVVLLDDTDCKRLMKKLVEERPDLWFEDIGD